MYNYKTLTALAKCIDQIIVFIEKFVRSFFVNTIDDECQQQVMMAALCCQQLCSDAKVKQQTVISISI